MNANTHKELYEALQAVNARLDAVGEQLLIGLVEALRTSLRAEQAALGGSMPVGTLGQTEATLKIWIEVDAAEEDEAAPDQPAWFDMRTAAEVSRRKRLIL